ncbi:MAG: NADH-quinone oxidoreductase subunit N [Flavobacteriales bacterium]|nr:NADH-quinone oxidoreductase subunit N [Flavobacteriales bacterium]
MKEIMIISLLGIVILAVDLIKMRKLVLPVTIAGLIALLGSCIMDWGHHEVPFAQYGGMLLFDNYALGFTMVFSVLAIFWFLMTSDQYEPTSSKKTDLYALSIFSICGAVVLSSYSSMVMLFLGVEILSIPLYVLAASDRKNILSNEAGFKYFFLGSLASAVMLFGIALIYGATGTFDLQTIATTFATGNYSGLMLTGCILILTGFAFKVSVAPFHLWAPDVYQGAPTTITAFMATIVKAAAFAGMYRLFATSFPNHPQVVTSIMAVMIALTLILSNITAVTQTSSKRLLAYSSLSHAGYMLGFVMMSGNAPAKYLMFYTLTYGIASMTSFSILQHVSSIQGGDDSREAFKGLVKRNPVMAGAMTVSLLSMAGIPPLSGFLGKYYAITQLLSGDYLALVIIMILTSAIAAYYYLRLIAAMFTPIENAGRIMTGGLQRGMYIVLTLLLLVTFFAASLLELIEV